MAKEINVTEEGLKKLQEQLEYLKGDKRKEIVEQIRVALSFGDLSENSEYDEAKNAQAENEDKIREIEEQLKNVKVISDDEIDTNTVSVGTKVLVHYVDDGDDHDGDENLTIVGSTESSVAEGKISDESPIGKALVGAKAGCIVTVNAPNGDYEIEIVSISK
ncbi:MAG: transcription elongation factor GreA [Firmicutes bacterium]|nr:transcription elongation factor GreA [Candidatus Colimorpha enterica]